jgi:hypothetical protein
MEKNQFERMDYFRGENADNLDIESRQAIDVAPVEFVHASVQANEVAQDGVDSQRDEKIDLWMKNIREFIRGIDVKAL